MNISYALTAAFGGLLSVLQGFDLGGLVVYLNYSKQVGQPLNQISQQMTTLLSALAGAERIFDVMDTQPEVDQGQVTLVEAGEGRQRHADPVLRHRTFPHLGLEDARSSGMAWSLYWPRARLSPSWGRPSGSRTGGSCSRPEQIPTRASGSKWLRTAR